MEGGFGPEFMQGGAVVAIEFLRAGPEHDLITGDRRADLARGHASLCEKGQDLAGMAGADLDHCPEFFAEEHRERIDGGVLKALGGKLNGKAGAAGKGHLEQGDEEAAVRAVVIGEEFAIAVELLNGFEEALESGWAWCVGR